MKMKVMIVEDEQVIRRGLQKVIPWEQLGCELAAAVENGAQGCEKAMEIKPQLVISDIRMPKMDGLEMTRILRGMFPKLRVILLTGYKEFEYAQKALEYGVEDYVLKPVDHEELISVIRKQAEEFQHEEEEEKERERLREQLAQSLPILRDKFLSSLLFSSPETIYHIYERMDYFNIRIRRFILMAVEIDSFYALEKQFSEEDIQILLFLIENQIENAAGERALEPVIYRHEKAVYVILPCSEEENMDDIILFAREVEENIRSSCSFTVSVGISAFHEEAMQVRQARKEAEACITRNYYLGPGNVICYGDICTEDQQENLCPEICPDAYYQSLRSGQNITGEMEKLCEELKGTGNLVALKSSALELVSKSFRLMVQEYGESRKLQELMDGSMEQVFTAKNIQGYLSALRETSGNLESFLSEQRISRNRYLVEKAVAYMKANCTREVSLEEVSDTLYVSRWYFSKLFRKETGIKFSDYMIRLRVEEAQRLIRENPGLHNYEIADRLQFGNDRYFSQVFKKVAGMTPSEFRNGK